MTPERFRALLQAYGTDPARWPDDERSAARALAAQDSVELRQSLAEEARLDAWLDAHVVATPGDALVRRIVAAAAPAPAQPRTSSSL
jgi:GAF domain-containing protein